MGAVRDVLGIPAIRRLQWSWFGSVSVEYGAVVATSVYAYAEGGARAVALFGVLRMLPSLVLTPVVTSVADRIPRERLLLWTVIVRAAALALAAAAIMVDAPLLVVLAPVALESALLGVYRPAQNALLPWLVRTPDELTAANVLTSLLEGCAVFVGPVLVGVMLALSGPAAAMVALAVLMLGSVAALAGMRVSGQPAPERQSGGWARQLVADVRGGIAVYPATPGTSTMLVLAFLQTVVRGALNVLLVLLAVDVLDLGDSGLGWLNGAMGLGGLAGGLLAVRVVRGRWLARWGVLAIAGWGLPLAVLSVVDAVPLAFALLALTGVANAILDVAVFTALQRALPASAIGRALGVLETVALLGIGLGSALAPALLRVTDTQGSLLVAGLLLVVAALLGWRAGAVIDRNLAAPGPDTALLRRLPMFAPLPLVTVEHLASRLQHRTYDDGSVVIREGDPGDDFHVIVDGTADVSIGGRPVRTMTVGDGFGEIALLRNVPRTATVAAQGPLRTAALERSEFLAALSVSAASASAADVLVTGRLAAGAAEDGPR